MYQPPLPPSVSWWAGTLFSEPFVLSFAWANQELGGRCRGGSGGRPNQAQISVQRCRTPYYFLIFIYFSAGS